MITKKSIIHDEGATKTTNDKPLAYRLQERLVQRIREDERNKCIEDVEKILSFICETEGWTNHHNTESVIIMSRLKTIFKKQLQELKEKNNDD